MKPLRPVAITGMGCLCAAGLNLDASMDALFRGKRHPKRPSKFSGNRSVSYPVFEIAEDFFPSGEMRISNVLRTCKLALAAASEALDNAGWDRDALHGKRVGVCIGTNVGSSMNNEAFYRKNREGCDPYVPPAERFLVSNPTSSIIREFGLAGPCQTVVNACSAGSDAIGLAASWIRSGICDMVITGGADEMYQVTYNGFISLMISDDAPCKPFDARRKGLNLGEGAGMLILESEAMLRERKKTPRAFVLGYGSASDAYHLTAPRPDGKGLKLAIAEAMKTSGTGASDIAFVNAHGTGTLDNDRIEGRVLNEMLPDVPFLSTKGYVGHTLGASGAIEAAFTVACLERGEMPSSAGFSEPDPELPASPVQKITKIRGPIAMSETLAFGGNNAVLVLGVKP